MHSIQTIKKELEKVFTVKQSSVLSKIIADSYSELVKTGDFNELKEIVRDLAQAQNRTELKVEELADAQKELADAQKRTENSLNRLIGRVDIIEDRVEGISNSVGYSLEDMACKALPELLKKEGIEVTGELIRRYYELKKGKFNQINIYGKAKKEGRELLILGESKVRPSKSEIDRFLKIVEHIKEAEGNPDVFLLFAAYDYHPNTENYLKEKGIRYFWTYQLK